MHIRIQVSDMMVLLFAAFVVMAVGIVNVALNLMNDDIS